MLTICEYAAPGFENPKILEVLTLSRKHEMIYRVLTPLVKGFLKIKFGYKWKKAENLPENYIVLSNHVTDYDPLLVAVSFPKQMYFVASEHITRWGFAYTLLKELLHPIIRYKGTVATATVIESLRKIRAGGSVAIFAEGVRTWDGVTCPILPSTAKMVKTAGCGLVTYKIQGGHFVSPGWKDHGIARGPLSGGPVRVYTREELKAMSVDEVYKAICDDLYEDAYARQLADPKPYRGKDLAVGLENLLFTCPTCGKRNTLSSAGDSVTCDECGLTFTYDEYAMLHGVPFKTVKQFADWQKEQVARDAAAGEVYSVEYAALSTIVNHEATQVAAGPLSIGGDVLKCDDYEIPVADIADMGIHGRHALVFSAKGTYYELLPAHEFSIQQFLLYYNCVKKK